MNKNVCACDPIGGGSKSSNLTECGFCSKVFHRKQVMEQWNVTPLLGHFGGRVGICSFYRLLCLWCSPLSLSFLLIPLSFLFPLGGCVYACRPEGYPNTGRNISSPLGLPTLKKNGFKEGSKVYKFCLKFIFFF